MNATPYQPKPRNWRQFFGYRPSRALTWRPYRIGHGTIERQYIEWLKATYALSEDEAEQRVARQDELARRPKVQAHHYGAQTGSLGVLSSVYKRQSMNA